MSKLPMDLSKFRKVKSDKHTSTFEHHEGHTITVAHNKLSSKMRDSLHKIPLKEKQNYAEGGKVQHYAEGTDEVQQPADSSDKDNYSNLLSEKAKYYQTNDPNLSYGNAIAKAATEVEGRKSKAAAQDLEASTGEQRRYEASMASLPKSPQEAAAQESRAGYPPLQGVQVAGLSPTSGMEELPISPGARLPAAEGLQGPATMPKPAIPGAPGLLDAQQQQLSGLEKIGAGQQAEAKAQGQLGKLNIAAEDQYAIRQQKALDEFTKANETITSERAALTDDIAKNHIDPRAYIDKMSTGDRIRTGIGLIIGGMGAGLTGGPNMALQYFQKQIDSDIEAQKSNLGKKETLLSHNLKATGDLRDAYNLTKIHSNDILVSQLRRNADEIADPVAKAKLMQIAGATDQATAQLQQQMAISKMVSGGSSDQSEESYANRLAAVEQLKPEAAKEMREKFVPGVGLAAIPVPEKAREAFEVSKGIDKILNRAMDFQEEHSGIGTISGSAASGRGASIRSNLLLQLKELNRLGAISETDLELMNGMVPPIGSMFNARTKAKLDEVKDFLNNKMEIQRSTYRIKPFSDTATGKPPANQIRFKKD